MQEDHSKDEYVLLDSVEDSENRGFRFKIEAFLESRYFLVVSMVLIAFIAFLLGRVSTLGRDRPPVRVLQGGSPVNENIKTETMNGKFSDQSAAALTPGVDTISNKEEMVVASKNGTKYHYPWCTGAKQISEKNLIKFSSIAEARAKGYTPASNCKGLK